MRKILCLFQLFIIIHNVSADDGYLRRLNFDVLNYEFAISINDSTDRIDGRASIKIKIHLRVGFHFIGSQKQE